MGTVFGKQLELDQIVGCSTIFSYKATQTPTHSSYTTKREEKLKIFILTIINFSFVSKWFEPKVMLEEFEIFSHFQCLFGYAFNTIIITFLHTVTAISTTNKPVRNHY